VTASGNVSRTAERPTSSAFVFTAALAGVILLHLPLLRLPYFWDEAGYYIPAARDLLLTGSLIPHSTPSNAHPPLVMAWLALWWKIGGFAPLVTRLAMLTIAAFSLTGLFRLAQRIANTSVAVASVICTGLYPVFFAQSSLAHVDLAAAGFIFWALDAYFARRWGMAAFWFSLAVLSKETAILVPAALLAWTLITAVWALRSSTGIMLPPRSLLLLAPFFVLALWYLYHYRHTGFVFGNPEFFRYNVASTTHPLRILLAFLMRLWQTLGYFDLILLTALTLIAMTMPPVSDNAVERRRIALPVQFALLSVVVVYVLAMSVIGGAVLARYMLPIVPLVIIVGISTLRRRMRAWRFLVAAVALAFVIGLFVNPPYGFSPEDNLAYCDFIHLHQHAEDLIEARYPTARVLTAWPANEELSRPYLGYVARPMQVVRIEDFTVEQLMSAADQRELFDVALVFSTKYDPPHAWFERWRTWQQLKTRFFGYHRDVPPEAAAQILGGHLVYSEHRKGQWIGVIEIDKVQMASAKAPRK